MLELNHLSFSYRTDRQVLCDIDTRIDTGIHLLLGENGAGKTTLLHLLAGWLTPVAGTCTFNGMKPQNRKPDFLSRVFFLPDSFETPFSNIEALVKGHAGFYPRFSEDMLAENLSVFRLDAKTKFKNLSLGFRRKAYLAYALALRTELLLLDEPANGLDINSRKEMRRIFSRCIEPDQTVIVSTHTVADLEVLFDGLIIIRNGQLLLSSPLTDIENRLCFTSSAYALPDALYQEPDMGVYRCIVPATDNPESSGINFNLLYSALMSESRNDILKILNS